MKAMFLKAIKAFALFSVLSLPGLHAQTATNWNVTDCDGIGRELFADLDAGKVVVVIWVMPCGTCIDEALSAQSAVQNANASHPGKVIYYVVDDYGNSDCNLLEGWCVNNSVTDGILITNKLVSMGPYGEAGMPKVVVFGGSAHKVFYNQNGPNVTESAIASAIDAAIAETVTGLDAISGAPVTAAVYPNPFDNSSVVSITVNSPTELSIELLNSTGQVIKILAAGKAEQGRLEFPLSAAEFPDGIYFLRVGNGNNFTTEKIVITR